MREELIKSFSADLEALKKRLPHSKGQRRKTIIQEIEEIESTISFLVSRKQETPSSGVIVIERGEVKWF